MLGSISLVNRVLQGSSSWSLRDALVCPGWEGKGQRWLCLSCCQSTSGDPWGGEALASAEPGWELGTPPPNVLIVTKALQPAA